jgi:hypothetical protein
MYNDQAATVGVLNPHATPAAHHALSESSIFPSAIFGVAALVIVTIARYLRTRERRHSHTLPKTRGPHARGTPAHPASSPGRRDAERRLRLVSRR